MRKGFAICLFSLSMLVCVMAFGSSKGFAAEVAINKENFPGKSFREYVRTEIDNNRDGILSEAEILATKEIFAGVEEDEKGVSDYKGIEYFSNLERLEILGYDEIESIRTVDVMLDVSRNVKLKQLTCQALELRQLNLSGLTELEEVKIRADLCPSLDLSKSSKLKELEILSLRGLSDDRSDCVTLGDMPVLGNLSISGLSKVEGDFRQMPALRNVILSVSEMSGMEMNLSGNRNLKTVYCSNVKDIPSIQLQDCPNLEEVILSSTGVQTINVHNCPKVNKLTVSQAPGTRCLRIIGGEDITWLGVSGQTIPQLDVKELVKLQTLNLSGNIKKIILHNAQGIKGLAIEGGKNFDFSPYTGLENLSVTNMKMKQLDVSKHDKLKSIKCYDMKKLEKLRLCKNAVYSKLIIKKTGIRRLDVRKIRVEKLIYADNKAKQLLVRGNRTLQKLDCRNNQLTKLDLRGCRGLKKKNLLYTGNKKLKKRMIKK